MPQARLRGYKLTICGMCYKVIELIWVMSAEEREEKLRNGMTFDALVLHNKMLKEIAEATWEDGAPFNECK